MKNTLNQRQNILNGERKVKEKVNYAYHEMLYSCSEIGTMFSKRGKRSFKVKLIKKMKIGTSGPTGVIYAGRVSKTGLWLSGKVYVTDTAPMAVAEHLLIMGERIRFIHKNGKTYELKVEEVKP